MKALIIYISVHHGNTGKIARAMAESLDAELLKPGEVDITTLPEYDLIGFGSGIYVSKHHKSLLNFVSNMPVMKNKKTFIFSTMGMGSAERYHRALREKLLEKELDVVGEFSCRGLNTFGPLKLIGGMNKGRPDGRDLENAGNFAKGLKGGG
jgi:flavodoxin